MFTSFPGTGDLSGAWLLTEIGDDRTRFADARVLKAYVGSAPHQSLRVQHRHHTPHRQNDRLNAVGFLWAFASIPRPGPAKNHYDRRRTSGDRHATAPVHRTLGQDLAHHTEPAAA